MRTTVLFICHEVCEESIFRFNHIKESTDELGYKLVWVYDAEVTDTSKLPAWINVFGWSWTKAVNETPFLLFKAKDGDYEKSPNATPMSVFQYHLQYGSTYDRLWAIEYDVCFMGKWKTFFNRYDFTDYDMIAFSAYQMDNPRDWKANWSWFKKIDEKSRDIIWKSSSLNISYNFCCRLSASLIQRIINVYKKRNVNLNNAFFFEWSWITTAKAFGYKTLKIQSNGSGTWQIDKTFNDYLPDMPYHAVKLGMCWRDKMNLYCK